MRQAFTLIELMIVIAIIAIIAAIAIPNLLESRVTANEGAAGATLKSGIFPAEVQWKAGCYQDYNSNTIGEYGTLAHLAGKQMGTSLAANITLLTGPLSTQALGSLVRNANGYAYMARIPSINGIATTDEGSSLPPITAAAGGQTSYSEQYFVVGCAPERYSDTGRRVFLITQDGQVRSPAGSTAAANNDTWMGAAVATNPAPTAASIIAGINTYYATANNLSTLPNFDRYPVYSK